MFKPPGTVWIVLYSQNLFLKVHLLNDFIVMSGSTNWIVAEYDGIDFLSVTLEVAYMCRIKFHFDYNK